jgi:hypothetical protein
MSGWLEMIVPSEDAAILEEPVMNIVSVPYGDLPR